MRAFKYGAVSKAQEVARKHNGDCRIVAGCEANLKRVLFRCREVLTPNERHHLSDEIDNLCSRMREIVDKEFEAHR